MSAPGEQDTVEQSLISLIIQLPANRKDSSRDSAIKALDSWRLLRVKLQRFTILNPAERTELYSGIIELLGLLDSLKKIVSAHSKNSPVLFFIDKASTALKKKYSEVQDAYA